jgi:hypothetical protein
MRTAANTELKQEQVLLFFVAATLMFIVPLLLVDSLYSDDLRRAHGAIADWTRLGRPLIDWFYQGLSFSHGVPDVFPLPLLMAVGAISLALRSLVNHYFAVPNLACCLVVLPLWYSPFFLENLSFQYDGPVMTLGVVAMIYAISYHHRSWLMRNGVAALCIALGLSIYQMVINVYLGLCCLEVIRVASGGDVRGVIHVVRDCLMRLFVGTGIYWLSAYQLMDNERTALRQLDSGLFEGVGLDLLKTGAQVALLYTRDNAWLCGSLIVLGTAGLGLVLYRIVRTQALLWEKTAVAALCLICPLAAAISIPGLALIFEYFNVDARLMMGLASALVLVFFLSYQALTAIHSRLGLLLIIPVLAMLSFSFVHGRVLAQNKALSSNLIHHISYDITTHPELSRVQAYKLFDHRGGEWLAGASETYRLLPALPYVLHIIHPIYPEMFPHHAGITNVSWGSWEDSDAIYQRLDTGVPPTLSRKFYSIYVNGSEAHIVLTPASLQ